MNHALFCGRLSDQFRAVEHHHHADILGQDVCFVPVNVASFPDLHKLVEQIRAEPVVSKNSNDRKCLSCKASYFKARVV